jgi:prolyl-tRNA synthetase
MLAAALAERNAHTADAKTLAAARDAGQDGFARLPLDVLGESGEDDLARSAISVRCIQRADGSVPLSEDEPDLYAIVARAY